MATMLNDENIKKLFGTVIANADENCLRPNSYVLRLGKAGEFLNTEKIFKIGKNQGIKIPPSYSVGITALEDIDFSRETVHKIFPGHDLHALISPTTDLSREGIVAPATQVDAGYRGTLNWTLTNNSSKEASFTYGEKIYRMTIFKLEEGETPDAIYSGDYQDQRGYVGSRRKGAPVGMKDSQWIRAFAKEGPEVILEQLINSGYPWSALGTRLKEIDQKFETVTEEYSKLDDSIGRLEDKVNRIGKMQEDIRKDIREIIRAEIREQASDIQNRGIIKIITIFLGFLGIIIAALSSERMIRLLNEYGGIIGVSFILLALGIAFLTSRNT
ncbi:MAG: hypothetical protein OXU54_01180 [Gammaproteobacteria bacterium]|nr:hypothetical protein [Gammaproteobacteria bacterium]MDD9863186.1 hypothetical protein [Gammaproteobacteria bacterium]